MARSVLTEESCSRPEKPSADLDAFHAHIPITSFSAILDPQDRVVAGFGMSHRLPR
jgi:hypothetical protein